MRDSIGNKIDDKSLLCWHIDPEQLKRGLIVQAVSVSDGGISMGDSKELTPATLVVQVPIFVNVNSNSKGEPTLPEFVCIVNPNSERIIEGMLTKPRERTQ